VRLVKRVVGLPGDVIESRHDRLYVNGAPVVYAPASAGPGAPGDGADVIVAEEHLPGRNHPVMIQLRRPALRTFGPIRVSPGCYFMMGDNRDDSHDSRYFGCVSRERIIGRAATVIASADPAHWLRPRGDRLLREIP